MIDLCNKPFTYVDEHGCVARAQIVKHRGVVEERQVGHVLGFLEFRWVHLLDELLLEGDLEIGVSSWAPNPFVYLILLDGDNFDGVSLLLHDLSGNETVILIGHPAILFRVIGLRLLLKYEGDFFTFSDAL